jgi:hypothetical protein
LVDFRSASAHPDGVERISKNIFKHFVSAGIIIEKVDIRNKMHAPSIRYPDAT